MFCKIIVEGERGPVLKAILSITEGTRLLFSLLFFTLIFFMIFVLYQGQAPAHMEVFHSEAKLLVTVFLLAEVSDYRYNRRH